MARQTVVSYLDDLDGSAAEGEISFALDNVNYEIDLSAENAEKLREALAPFIAAGRRVSGGRSGSVSRAGRSTPGRSREETQEIRSWLKENGYTVSDRGRIGNDLIAAWESKTPAQALEEPKSVEASTEVPAETSGEAEKPKRTRKPKAPEGSNLVQFSGVASGE